MQGIDRGRRDGENLPVKRLGLRQLASLVMRQRSVQSPGEVKVADWMCGGLCRLLRCAAAMLVFFPAAARAGIVATNIVQCVSCTGIRAPGVVDRYADWRCATRKAQSIPVFYRLKPLFYWSGHQMKTGAEAPVLSHYNILPVGDKPRTIRRSGARRQRRSKRFRPEPEQYR